MRLVIHFIHKICSNIHNSLDLVSSDGVPLYNSAHVNAHSQYITLHADSQCTITANRTHIKPESSGNFQRTFRDILKLYHLPWQQPTEFQLVERHWRRRWALKLCSLNLAAFCIHFCDFLWIICLVFAELYASLETATNWLSPVICKVQHGRKLPEMNNKW